MQVFPTLDSDGALLATEKQIIAFKDVISKIDRTVFPDLGAIDSFIDEFSDPVYITLSRKPLSKVSFAIICRGRNHLSPISIDSKDQRNEGSSQLSRSAATISDLNLFSIVNDSLEVVENCRYRNRKSYSDTYTQTENIGFRSVSVQTRQQDSSSADITITSDSACQTDNYGDSEFLDLTDSDRTCQATAIQRTLIDFRKDDEDKGNI